VSYRLLFAQKVFQEAKNLFVYFAMTGAFLCIRGAVFVIMRFFRKSLKKTLLNPVFERIQGDQSIEDPLNYRFEVFPPLGNTFLTS
jgi:hypothetical protein